MHPPSFRLWRGLGILILGFGAVSAGPAAAQEAITIRDSCGESWSITTSLVTRIGGIDDPGQFVQTPGGVTRDSRGRIWISFPWHALYVYDADGSFITAVGREGQGPGEYRSIRGVSVQAGDTVHVFDRSNQRLTILSPDLRVVDTRPLEVRPWGGIVRLDDGNWVLNEIVTTPARRGYPLHLVDATGVALRSFGALTPSWRADFQLGSARALAAAPGGRVWAAHRTQYRIELWDTENRLHRALVRQVDWFEPRVAPGQQRPPRTPPDPVLSSIHLDQEGVLWTRSLLPRDDYDSFLEEVEPGRWFPREPTADAFRVVVEAIDPERACVLARLDAGASFLRIIEDGWFSAYRETPEGIPWVELHRIELVRR